MKNQKYSPKDRSVSHHGGTPPKNAQEENKEPSVLDKLKDQIKKIKDLKEGRPGTSGDDAQ